MSFKTSAKGRPVTLYKLEFGSKPVLTYAESADYLVHQAHAIPIVGGALMALGVFATLGCSYTQGRHARWASAGSEERYPSRSGAAAEDPLKKVTWISIAVSAALYAVIVGVNFAPEVRAKLVQAFGPEPLGLPVLLLVSVVDTILFLPVPWVFWHVGRIAYEAHLDGKRFNLVYLFTAGNYHPQLRRSQMICFGGLLYFAVIAAAWISYAASRGI